MFGVMYGVLLVGSMAVGQLPVVEGDPWAFARDDWERAAPRAHDAREDREARKERVRQIRQAEAAAKAARRKAILQYRRDTGWYDQRRAAGNARHTYLLRQHMARVNAYSQGGYSSQSRFGYGSGYQSASCSSGRASLYGY